MMKVSLLLIIGLAGINTGYTQTRPPLPVWAGRYETVRPSEDVFIVTRNQKMGVVGRLGKPLTQLVYDTIFDFREGMAIVGRGHREVNQFGKVSSDFKYGYLTKAGRLVVPMQYESVEPYREGLGLINEIHPYGGSRYIYYSKQGNRALSYKMFTKLLSFRAVWLTLRYRIMASGSLPTMTVETMGTTHKRMMSMAKPFMATISTMPVGCSFPGNTTPSRLISLATCARFGKTANGAFWIHWPALPCRFSTTISTLTVCFSGKTFGASGKEISLAF